MSVVAQLPGPVEQELPKVFGRYLLLKRLSRGGMGEIFLAKLGEIQGFEKLVIIKKILPNLVADQEFIKRFIDEAQVAIKLQHANIAPVFEVGKVDGEYFLAIEYIEGRDLRRMIARQREERTRLPPDLAPVHRARAGQRPGLRAPPHRRRAAARWRWCTATSRRRT